MPWAWQNLTVASSPPSAAECDALWLAMAWLHWFTAGTTCGGEPCAVRESRARCAHFRDSLCTSFATFHTRNTQGTWK
jgi:hypothetical protein